MIKYFYTFFIITLILTLNGCSASGHHFEQFETPEKNYASVYFYRPEKFIGGAVPINIMEDINSADPNKKKFMAGIITIGKLRNNSYFNIKTIPGEHKFTTNWFFNPFIFRLNANQVYCIKTEHTLISHFFSSRPPLKLIPKEVCEKEIKKTKLMTEEDMNNFFY